MKQLQLLFEMKSRNEDEHLKTLKVLEKLERERTEERGVGLSEAYKKIEELRLDNAKLLREREEQRMAMK